MILNNLSKDIILISYPSGGFGNFLYYVLASDTIKTDNGKIKAFYIESKLREI